MFNDRPTSQEPLRTQDLLLPSLLVLAQAERLGQGPVSSAQLTQALEPALGLSSADREITQADTGSRFSRRVRNMVSSHQTLEEMGVAKAVAVPGTNRTHLRITPKGQAMLCDHMLGMFSGMLPAVEALNAVDPTPRVVEGAPRMLEAALVDIALLVLARTQADNGGKPVSTTLLRRAVKSLPSLNVSPEDTQVLAGRKDTKLDQILRNLIGSHKTLTKNRWARQTEAGLTITRRGKAHLLPQFLKRLPAPALAADAPAPRRRAPSP